MKPKSLFLLTLAATVALLFTFYPGKLFSPGGLHKTHADVESCETCHDPFTKPGGEKCTSSGCHDSIDWEKDKGIFTGHLEKLRCIKCHTEHKGSDGLITLVKPHTNIPADSNCLECHRLGTKHSPVKVQDCKVCHSIEKWKPAKGGHDTVKNISDCIACHTLPMKHFKSTENCSACHSADKWKPAKFDHKKYGKGSDCNGCHTITLKHFRTSENCSVCHTVNKWKPAKFDHKKYAKGNDCTGCHKLPAKHIKTDANCSECHTADKWKPAIFDHKRLAKGSDCIACHKLPKKHFKSTANCSECHSADKWKPSTFDHRFPMQHETKRKKNSCETCHPVSLDKYDCYTGCHEHSVRKVRREHLEEGIREYSDCMECHPTGREHERRGKYKKDKKRSDDHKSRKRHHDDDDDDHDDHDDDD